MIHIAPSTRNLLFTLFTLSLAACGGGGGSSDSGSGGGSSSGGPVSSSSSSSSSSNSSSSSSSSSSGGAANTPPTANAATDSQIPIPSGRQVVLIGEGEDEDGDALSYAWSQTSGPAVELLDDDQPNASFITPDENGELTFQLLVNDGKENSLPAEIPILVQNTPPQITSLSLSPAPAYTDTELRAEVSVSNRDGRDLSYVYTWLVNGEEVANTGAATLAPEHFQKGNQVQVALQITDGYNGDTDSAQLIISDSSPEVTLIGVPETANYGEPLSFQVLVEDADGDPVDFRFLARPNGMEIDEEGNVTWTPHGPLFAKETDFNWKVSVSGGNLNEILGSQITVADPEREPPLSRSGIEVPRYSEGLHVSDLNSDGIPEILIADGDHRLYSLAFDGSGYVQDWLLPFSLTELEDHIGAITVGDKNDDGYKKIFAGISDRGYASDTLPAIAVLDGKSRKFLKSEPTGGQDILALRIADFDSDGGDEIAALIDNTRLATESESRQHFEIRDIKTLELEWESPKVFLGNSMAAGNVDTDAHIELVFSNGDVFGFDENGYSREWRHPSKFGERVETADLNGNGRDEIIGNPGYSSIKVYDAAQETLLTEAVTHASNISVRIMEDKSHAELLVGGGQSTMYGYTMLSGYSLASEPQVGLLQNWTIEVPESPFIAFGSGDFDQDGSTEFLYGPGSPSVGTKSLIIASRESAEAVEWQNTDPSLLDGPFSGGFQVRMGAGSKVLSFATTTTESDYGGARIVTMDPATGTTAISIETGSNWENSFASCPVDLDSDNVDELFIATSQIYTPYLSVYDFIADEEQRLDQTIDSPGITVLAKTINADPTPEIITTTVDGKITAYDINETTPPVIISGYGGRDLEAADLDGDKNTEFIAASDSAISVLRGLQPIERIYSTPLEKIQDLSVGDINSDGLLEIIAITSGESQYESSVFVYDYNLELLSSFTLNGLVVASAVENYGSSHKNLLLAVNTPEYPGFARGRILVLDPISGLEVFRSPPLSGRISFNSLHLVDFNGDRVPEISYGTHQAMNTTR